MLKPYKQARKRQKRAMKARKQKLIKLVKQNYSDYDYGFILDFLYMSIENLLEYHKKGDNVWCSEEQHNDIVKSLKENHEIAKLFMKATLSSDNEMQLLRNWLDHMADHVLNWWD